MPPKETPKKPAAAVARPPISDSSLLYVPDDAVEGYQERIETGIEWTLVEEAARHHKKACLQDVPKCAFTEALKLKLDNSVFHTFLDDDSKISLDDQWELLLPITIWDNEKFANEEAKICYRSANNLIDDMDKIIKKAVKNGDRSIIMKDFYLTPVLRVNDAKMTELDSGLAKFKKVVTLTLCGNFLQDIDTTCLPLTLKTLELQANRIKSVESFAEHLPFELLYLGLSRNLLNDDSIEGLSHIPYNITVLDLSDNDIYWLEPLLQVLVRLPNLTSLHLAGNPCAGCAAYARLTLMRLPRLRWLDSREILVTDRSVDPFEPHPDDLRAAYFNFTVFRVMSAPQPPKPEKGAITTFHVELELPLLDTTRRAFLMFRRNESLTEMLPPPEDGDWSAAKMPSVTAKSKSIMGNNTEAEIMSGSSDIYNRLEAVNSREIRHFTKFESNKIIWNKVMNFQEPTVKIFCPDLVALRNTFRCTITVRLIYSITIPLLKDPKLFIGTGTIALKRIELKVARKAREIQPLCMTDEWTAVSKAIVGNETLKMNFVKFPGYMSYKNSITVKPTKMEKKSQMGFKQPAEQRVTLATIKCPLRRLDWSQSSQHFHWDDSLGTDEAIHWGDGDLSVIQYSQAPVKVTKGKPDSEVGPSRQLPPENLTCHFGFGIDTLRA